MDLPSKNSRTEKSRKRPREVENDNFFDVIKKKSRDLPVINPTVKFSDIGGNTIVLETVANLLLHMKHPEIYTKLGISPPRGFLLHGPPGCGKTLLAHAIAGELKMPLLKVAAPELIAGISGESEQRIRELFEQAITIAPCILFLDEIDAVAPQRATAQKEMERRIVSQLLLCLDELGMKSNGNKILVLGATNRPDSLDPALRRAGRFDREISLGIPDKEARAAILKIHTINVILSPEINLLNIASLTPGFVGADLVALIREAAIAAVNRTFESLKKNVTLDSIEKESLLNETSTEDVKEKLPVPVTEITDLIIEKSSIKPNKSTVESKTEDASNVSKDDQQNKHNEQKISENQSERLELSDLSVPPSSTQTQVPLASLKEEQLDIVIEANTTDKPLCSINDVPSSDQIILSTNSQELEPTVIDVQKIQSSKKLSNMLTWLHNEPPLTSEQLAKLCIEERDFEIALKNVQPSAKREGFATVPDVTWDDIGSLQDIRQELQMSILAPIRHSEHFVKLGLTTPTGVLLCGPPGCGKTLLAKAIANEAGINFISVKGPELLNMYVGESEKAVRMCFMRARNSAPCVIFFDELDSLCPKRSEGDSTATSRVVNQMLTEMDGVESRKEVFLMAASNRPDIIDPAVLRPGRLDKILYVGLPNTSDRVDILQALTKNGTKPKLAEDVNLQAIGGSDRCDGYTGADLAALIREAGVEALREIMSGISDSAEICTRHLNAAFDKIRPSVQEKDIKHYEKLQKLYSIKKCHNIDVPMTLEPSIDITMEAMET
ncbi:PREDICTED: nuclear valosin-containing protein-like [Ceratosolen solmsi marchali]|uniref:Nuclear valosin-containing protein-like n=1 Tax=Ceratosolen solmsi marchali TaxID=326594 RepID=A0AAJ6YVN5_9HYME|nr:PREDICTED: nuclear valosin-containing protein-like [Ceratosolen solmsi marchali]